MKQVLQLKSIDFIFPIALISICYTINEAIHFFMLMLRILTTNIFFYIEVPWWNFTQKILLKFLLKFARFRHYPNGYNCILEIVTRIWTIKKGVKMTLCCLPLFIIHTFLGIGIKNTVKSGGTLYSNFNELQAE